MKKLLVIGSQGQVGFEISQQVQRQYSSQYQLKVLDRDNLDLSQPQLIQRAILNEKPDIIINAAAYTAVDKAESEPDLAQVINATAVYEMARAIKKINALMIHYSTDYVFSGEKTSPYTETDLTNPLGVYGSTKRQGELALESAGCNHLTFRISWIYAARGKNFLLTMLRLMKERPEIKIVEDQTGTPTPASWIAQATLQLLQSDNIQSKLGLYHMTPQGQTSWYNFAKEILKQAHELHCLDTKTQPRLLPIPTSDYPTPAKRPQNSLMSSDKLFSCFSFRLPEWQQGLRETLTVLKNLQ